MTKTLILVRGLPGSGKTTFANTIGTGPVLSADDYFMTNGKYEFNINLLGKAHENCLNRTEKWMQKGTNRIFVANTFTTKREMKPYFEIADKYGYMTFSVIVENRHGNKSVHNVAEETMDKMHERFDIQL